MSARYAVMQNVICGGWTNTWSTTDDDGKEIPLTFATEAEAEAEIDEFLKEIQDEVDSGERDEDQGYDADEFCIVEIEA